MLKPSKFGIMEVAKGGIIMLKNLGQTEMELSPYQGLYDAIIPKDHILRRLKENIDFSFVNPMLKKFRSSCQGTRDDLQASVPEEIIRSV